MTLDTALSDPPTTPPTTPPTAPNHVGDTLRFGEPVVRMTTPPSPTDLASPRRPARYIALMNQKGGVGKTTTTVNLGAALARAGRRVLLIDLDPQAHLTLHLGIDPESLESSVYDLLTDDRVAASDVLRSISDNLCVIPAEVSLAGAEAELAPKLVDGRAQRVLKRKIEAMTKQAPGGGFDYVIIDCPPSLGLLTVNALTFVNEVIVPMQAHFLSLQGLSKLLETVQLIRQSFNESLSVTGTILCMHDSNTILAGEVAADLEAFLASARDQDVPWRDAVVFKPTIRRNIKLAECPSFGRSIFDYEPRCAGAKDYEQLAKSVDAAAPAAAAPSARSAHHIAATG